MPSSHPAPVFVLQKWGRICFFFLWPYLFFYFFRIHVCFRHCFLCLTSYLPINHIPSGVWGAGGRAALYACSSVPVSLLPEEQITSLEVRKRMAHASCNKHTQCPTWAHYCVSISSQLYETRRQIHNPSKQTRATIPTNQTLRADGHSFMVDSFHKKYRMSLHCHKRN